VKTYDNHGKLISEINTSTTNRGDLVISSTLYNGGNPVSQNISVRDSQGKVTTTNVIGGKILP
jgi:hypothetical protein